MSRTRHHRSQKVQHCGHDLWGRGPGAGMSYTAWSKKYARQTVRSQKHGEIRAELDQPLATASNDYFYFTLYPDLY